MIKLEEGKEGEGENKEGGGLREGGKGTLVKILSKQSY